MRTKNGLADFAPVLRAAPRIMQPDSPIRPGLLLGPGGLPGAFCSGVVSGFVECGYGDSFNHVGGTSTGAAPGAFLLSMPRDGGAKNLHYTTIYTEEACSRNFYKSSIRIDVPWLLEVFKGSTGKGIDAARVLSHPTTYMTVATDWETGATAYLRPQTVEDLFSAIGASISIPVVSPKWEYNGRFYTDGGVSQDPFGIEGIMAQENPPTDLLVVTNLWEGLPHPVRRVVEGHGVRILGKRDDLPLHIQRQIAERHDMIQTTVAAAKARTDAKVCFHWLPEQRRSNTRDPVFLQKLVMAGYNAVRELLQD